MFKKIILGVGMLTVAIVVGLIFTSDVKAVVSANKTCVETDSGHNIYAKGRNTLYNSDGSLFTSALDYCKDENTVTEITCNGGQWDVTYDSCKYGCDNGKCKKSQNPIYVCSDSDGGMDYYVKGTLKGILSDGKNTYTTTDDYCSDDKSGNRQYGGKYVSEYSCTSGGYFTRKWYECPNGCVDGRCVEANKDVTFYVSVNNYPDIKDNSKSTIVPYAYVNMYTVVLNSVKNDFIVTRAETKQTGKTTGAKFTIKPGQMVQFEGFKTLEAANKGVEMDKVDDKIYPAYKNFGRGDGQLCQTNYFDVNNILKSNGKESCAVSQSEPFQDYYVNEEIGNCYLLSGDGYLAKTWNENKVWYIDGTYKHWFASESIFFSWYNNFANLTIVSQSKIDNFKQGLDVCHNY